MSESTGLRARTAGWTIADGGRREPVTAHRRPVTLTLDAADLAAATSSLTEHTVAGTVAVLGLSPAGLEITVRADDHAFWETAVLPVERTDDWIQGAADAARLAEVAAQVAAERATVELVVTTSGRVRLEGVDLPPVSEIPDAPRRPSAGGVVEHRVEIPPTLPDGVPIRLPGVALTLPSGVRRRFSRRGVSMANLYECEDGWYLSGIAQGRPMYALVGRVAVY